MPVSGLVLSLHPAPGALEQARAALGGEPRFTLGAPQGDRLPLVVEATGAEEADALLAGLWAVPGVERVDLVWADYADLDGEEVAQ